MHTCLIIISLPTECLLPNQKKIFWGNLHLPFFSLGKFTSSIVLFGEIYIFPCFIWGNLHLPLFYLGKFKSSPYFILEEINIFPLFNSASILFWAEFKCFLYFILGEFSSFPERHCKSSKQLLLCAKTFLKLFFIFLYTKSPFYLFYIHAK